MDAPLEGGPPRIRLPADPARGRVETALRRTILVVTIGLSCLLGYYTTPIALVLMGTTLVFTWRHLPFDIAGRLFGLAFALLSLSALFTTNSIGDLLPYLGFGSLILYTPLAALFQRAAHERNIIKLADFGLFGAASGLVVAMFYTFVEGQQRAGTDSVLTDPIRLAITALIFGFLALVGARAESGRHRFVYGLGPLMALAVIFMSGSRSPLMVFPVLLIVAAVTLVRRRALALGVGTATLLCFGLVLFIADLVGLRASTLNDIVARMLAGASLGDMNLEIRLLLYKVALPAFLEAPLFGHGWGEVMAAIRPFLSADEVTYANLPHLHNDAAQFAVAAGLPGLIAYPILLATPLVAAARSVRDGQYRTRLYGAGLLTVSHVVLGLPDVMVSFSLQVTLYVVLTALLLNYCRDEAG